MKSCWWHVMHHLHMLAYTLTHVDRRHSPSDKSLYSHRGSQSHSLFLCCFHFKPLTLIFCLGLLSFSIIALPPSLPPAGWWWCSWLLLFPPPLPFFIWLERREGSSDGYWQGVSEPCTCWYLYFWHVMLQSQSVSARFHWHISFPNSIIFRLTSITQ